MWWLTLLLATLASNWMGVTAVPVHPKFRPARPEIALPDTYAVHLSPRYTLAEHWKYIGVNVSDVATEFRRFEWDNHYDYVAADEGILEAVLTDPQVELVEQHFFISPPAPVKPPIPVDIETPEDHPRPHSISMSPFDDEKQKPLIGSDLPNNRKKRHEDGRSLWTDDSHWHIAMLTAGEKLSGRIPEGGNEYYTMTNPIPGTGVNIYIMDSGIQRTHEDFLSSDGTESRALNFKGLRDQDHSPYCKGECEMADSYGHGAHVAALAVGKRSGTAPGARAISVKVSDGGLEEFDTYRLATAVHDIIDEHINNLKEMPASAFKGSVINMSFNLHAIEVLKNAIDRAYQTGIPVVAAAGNLGRRVEIGTTGVPCMYDSVFCVGSIDRKYRLAHRSNWGREVDIFAPGEDVFSASHRDSHKYRELSGTSMASPLVAGILASFISHEGDVTRLRYPTWTYETLSLNSISRALSGIPRGDAETPNKLANTGLNNAFKEPADPYRRIDPSSHLSKSAPSNTCKIDLMEFWTCQSDEANLFANFTILGPDGVQIHASEQLRSPDEPGVSINDQDPHKVVAGSLPWELHITGEHWNNYIQFCYGDQAWTSHTTLGDNFCERVGGDWETKGPKCPGDPLVRKFECQWICKDGT